MEIRRETTLELQEELGQTPASFMMAAHLAEGAISVGRSIRRMIGLPLDQQFAWRDEWQAWRAWRSLVEAAGILVFLFPKVPLGEARGVSLLEFPLPAVGVNSREQAPGARVFSLLHEVVHIALAYGQDERVASRESRNDTEWEGVERFAEEAASEVIIPGEALDAMLRARPAAPAKWNIPQVRALAGRFRVTPSAMATRLRAAGAMSWDAYVEWKAEWSDYLAMLKPRRAGMATPVEKTLARAGRPFAQLVLEALDANRITAVDACQYLDLRFDHLDTLRADLRAGQHAALGEDSGD
jgi:Zn-dependent peptidase ImmA (M78 family)